MFKWIRWPGLIAFAVIAGGLTAFFLLLAGPLTKTAIEQLGTMANGAKVEVDSVSLSFNPLGLSINRLQVTDANEPMTNALEFKKAVAELELAPLLAGRGIVHELSVEDLEFGTARTTSGVVDKKVKEKPAKDEPSVLQEAMASIDLPDPKEILAKETLKTETAGENVKQGYAQSKANIDTSLAAVPDDAALKHYEDELKKLTSGDIKSLEDFKERKKQLDALKQQFKNDQAAIESARAAIAQSKKEMSEQITALKNAPNEDIAYLKNKYQINAAGAANLTALLFGDDAAQWAEKALYWYEIVKPYLASDGNSDKQAQAKEEPRLRDGRLVHFATNDPWPTFLIRQVKGSATLSWGNLEIAGQDITHEPKVLGKPAHLGVMGDNLNNMKSLNLNLMFDHTSTPGTDTLALDMKDWKPAPMKLGFAGAQLASSKTQVQANAMVSEGNLQATGLASFQQANFTGKGGNTFEREMTSALASITQFAVDAEAKGKLKSPKVKIGSDLDKQLSSAFNQRFAEKQKEFEAQLKAELNAKLEGYLGEHGDILNDLSSIEGGLNAKLDAIKALGKAELADYEAQQKQKAKEDAKKKVKKLF